MNAVDWLAGAGTLVLGMVLGVMAGLLGTGGGTFAIPVLVLWLGFGQKLAQGTALVMVVSNVFKGLLKYRGLSGLDLKLASTLALSGCLSTALSAAWALTLPGPVLQHLYGGFLVLLAALVALMASRKAPPDRPAAAWYWAVVPGLVGGLTLGLFGVGGAMLAVPLLVRFFGQSQVRAQGLGLALALPGCSISLLQYAASAQVNWVSGVLLAVGGLASVSLGVRWAHRISEQRLTQLFCLFLLLGGAIMLLR